jgi:hypothetical protein
MNILTQIQTGTHILKIINQHLDEIPECRHNLTEIIKQALCLNENKIGGVHPTTSDTNQQETGKQQQPTTQPVLMIEKVDCL